jgi:DNA polymerase elongation subunit (family B)
MVISPQVGLHANVAVLDYDSEYPNIIVKNNLSYETVMASGNVQIHCEGLLPKVMKRYLSRRASFKRIIKMTNEAEHQRPQRRQQLEQQWHWATQRASALKTILVSMYGTAGCCWSRFGNVLTFEEVNRISRQTMIRTKELALSMGFKVIYGDTDAVFVKKIGGSAQDYLNAANAISKETGLPISLSYHYKFLVLLPLEANEKIDALKRYYGITYDGQVIARGIEMRRHDTPIFIKAFQENLIKILLSSGNDERDVYNVGLEAALDLVTNTIDNIMTGEKLKVDELVIRRKIGRDLSKYQALFPHVSAALQLNNKGIVLNRGDNVDFIFTASKHKNPLKRVRAVPASELAEQEIIEYDKEKYLQLVLDAAETVLAPFGFNRRLLGDGSARVTDWKEALRRELQQSVALEAELGSM